MLPSFASVVLFWTCLPLQNNFFIKREILAGGKLSAPTRHLYFRMLANAPNDHLKKKPSESFPGATLGARSPIKSTRVG